MRASESLRETVCGCPIRASLGSLGHKWTLMVLRDVAFYERVRFSDILRSIDGLTARTLTFRLRELQRDGFVRKSGAHYELTEKGEDALPILAALTAFGVRHHADEVFKDGRPRDIKDIAPREPEEILGAVAVFATSGRHVRVPTRKS